MNYRKKRSCANYGKNNPMYGKNHSIKAKSLISCARLEKDYPYFKSEEFKDKMSDITRGSGNGMYGKTHSEASKTKMSESSKGVCVGSKNGMFGKKGSKAINGKEVYQYEDERMTILVNTFNTIGLALDYLSLKGHIGLDKAIKNKTKYKNYYWSKGKEGVETIREE